MADRRTLGVALEMTPEKRAFIQGGVTEAPKNQPAAKPTVEEEAPPDTVGDDDLEAPVAPTRPARRARSRRQVRAPLPQADRALLGLENLWIPLTTRLQPATAAALKRAGLEQKLRGQSPNTVQEIAEEAIQEWLRNCGYLE